MHENHFMLRLHLGSPWEITSSDDAYYLKIQEYA